MPQTRTAESLPPHTEQVAVPVPLQLAHALTSCLIRTGDASAAISLGTESNNGGEKNKSEAVRLFRIAADSGNSDGHAQLGRCYRWGWGVDKDVAEAVRLFQLAVAGGSWDATCGLGAAASGVMGLKRTLKKHYGCTSLQRKITMLLGSGLGVIVRLR